MCSEISIFSGAFHDEVYDYGQCLRIGKTAVSSEEKQAFLSIPSVVCLFVDTFLACLWIHVVLVCVQIRRISGTDVAVWDHL